MTPFVVGLTGGIGSGKSTVAELFVQRGAGTIDTDEIARSLTRPGEPAVAEVAQQFGQHYVAADGSMDREAMRRLVFSDPQARTRLEALLHPRIRAEVERALAGRRESYVLLVVPLLVETRAYPELIRRVLVVDCPEELQISRVVARSSLTPAQVRFIMASQASRAERLRYADDVIVNDSDLAALRDAVAALDARYRQLSASQ